MAREGAGAARRLVRRPSQGRLAGVCAGLAEYLDTDVALVRLAWVILSIFPGGIVGGFVAYLAAWIIMPSTTAAEPPVAVAAKRLTRSALDRKIAGVCGGIAEYLDIDATLVRVVWAVLTVVPGAVVFGVVAYAIAWFIMPADHRVSAANAPSAA